MPVPGSNLSFLFTDVEGSVRLWAADVEGTALSFTLHDEIIRREIENNNGRVFGTAGDSFRGVFAEPADAVAAGISCQRKLADTSWGEGPELRVRMGVHLGPATERHGDYLGPVPNTAARVEALGHGGQLLITSEVERMLRAPMDSTGPGPLGEPLLWLGEYRLRDVPDPMGIFQVGRHRFPSLRHVNPALSSLPIAATDLLGRDTEVPTVRDALSRHSVVTLTGYGGCGKTRLAIEVAHQELPSRPGGCYFVDLSAVVEEEEFPAAVAAASRLTLGGTDPTEQILRHFETREALIVLDNCEHLVEICAEFAERASQRCAVKILVTSRQRLDIDGERAVLVQPLDHDAETSPAVELFVERANAAQLDGDGAAAAVELDLGTVREICARLDGIPLAIELAAARVSVLSPAELLERMDDRFRLLSGGRHRRKRRTLVATLDWSYGLLEADEQQLFRRCGVFSGTFDLGAATAVSGLDQYLTIDLLQSLALKSLISTTVANGHSRFHLLETVRAYAIERLDDFTMLQSTRDLHLRHFGKLVHTTSWIESCDIARSTGLGVEWSNLSAALEWAATNKDWVAAADIALGCQGIWEHEVPAIEGRRWIEAILIGLEELGTLDGQAAPEGADRPNGEYIDRLTVNLTQLAMQLDDLKAMHMYLVRLDEKSSPTPAAQALGYRAFTRIRHNPDEAVALLGRAEALVKSADLGPEALTPALWARGTLALYDTRYGDAIAPLKEAFETAKRENAVTTHSVIAGLTYAANLVLLGEPQEAVAFLDAGTWDSIWDSSDIIRSLALIDIGEVINAAELVIGFGDRAMLGRLSRMPNDALVGFAALAISRDEQDRAWNLLRQAATPRTPASIVLAEGLADQLGKGVELRDIHRNRTVPLSGLDATVDLGKELARLRS